jgi:hypothetical protein
LSRQIKHIAVKITRRELKEKNTIKKTKIEQKHRNANTYPRKVTHTDTTHIPMDADAEAKMDIIVGGAVWIIGHLDIS